MKKKNIPAGLVAEALKDENNGHYTEAVITYGIAPEEVKRPDFRVH
jgi:hypothetical protein